MDSGLQYAAYSLRIPGNDARYGCDRTKDEIAIISSVLASLAGKRFPGLRVVVASEVSTVASVTGPHAEVVAEVKGWLSDRTVWLEAVRLAMIKIHKPEVRSHAHLRMSAARKKAYMKAAEPTSLTEWMTQVLDRAAGYSP